MFLPFSKLFRSGAAVVLQTIHTRSVLVVGLGLLFGFPLLMAYGPSNERTTVCVEIVERLCVCPRLSALALLLSCGAHWGRRHEFSNSFKLIHSTRYQDMIHIYHI